MTPIKLFGIAATLFLVACGSSPQHQYYLLNSNTQAPASGQAPSLGVGPITIPEYLNRSGMVYSEDGNRLHVARYERWAEPLEDGIQRVLGLNLSAALGTQNIRPHPWTRNDIPEYAVQVWLLGLNAGGNEAELVAEWRVTRRGEEPDSEVTQRISRLATSLAGPDWQAADTAAAYSELLQRLSDEIAGVIRTQMQEAASDQN